MYTYSNLFNVFNWPFSRVDAAFGLEQSGPCWSNFRSNLFCKKQSMDFRMKGQRAKMVWEQMSGLQGVQSTRKFKIAAKSQVNDSIHCLRFVTRLRAPTRHPTQLPHLWPQSNFSHHQLPGDVPNTGVGCVVYGSLDAVLSLAQEEWRAGWMSRLRFAVCVDSNFGDVWGKHHF